MKESRRLGGSERIAAGASSRPCGSRPSGSRLTGSRLAGSRLTRSRIRPPNRRGASTTTPSTATGRGTDKSPQARSSTANNRLLAAHQAAPPAAIATSSAISPQRAEARRCRPSRVTPKAHSAATATSQHPIGGRSNHSAPADPVASAAATHTSGRSGRGSLRTNQVGSRHLARRRNLPTALPSALPGALPSALPTALLSIVRTVLPADCAADCIAACAADCAANHGPDLPAAPAAIRCTTLHIPSMARTTRPRGSAAARKDGHRDVAVREGTRRRRLVSGSVHRRRAWMIRGNPARSLSVGPGSNAASTSRPSRARPAMAA